MRQTTKKQAALYLDVKDVMEELDVTRRQLRHWEENGLITPEIGRNRYTANDLERLKLIRRLVVDEHFPVEVVRRLFKKQLWPNEFDDNVHERARSGDLTNQVLDIDSGALLPREDMFGQLWGEFLASADGRELERRLLQLILVYFRELRAESRTPLGYRGVVEETLTRIQELSRIARLEVTYDESAEHDPLNPPFPTGLRFRPLMPDETEESTSNPEALVRRNETLITELEEVDTNIIGRGRHHAAPHRDHRLRPLSDFTDLKFGR